MKNYTLTIPVRQYLPGELPAEDQALVDAAKKATDDSYAPYSHFHVGAALLLADGSVVIGANQENAAFGAGTCGERSACYNAGATHKGVPISKIAIAARKDHEFQESPISPCGICRQALLEFETRQGKPIEVLLYGEKETLVLPSVASLLPLCFTEF